MKLLFFKHQSDELPGLQVDYDTAPRLLADRPCSLCGGVTQTMLAGLPFCGPACVRLLISQKRDAARLWLRRAEMLEAALGSVTAKGGPWSER